MSQRGSIIISRELRKHWENKVTDISEIRRRILGTILAAPFAGLIGTSVSAEADTPQLLPIANGLIGYGVIGRRVVNLFRSRYPFITSHTNSMTIVHTSTTEDSPAEVESIKVSEKVNRMAFVIGLGEFSGFHGVAAIRTMVEEGLLPIEECLQPQNAQSIHQVGTRCLAILPFETDQSMFIEALEQEKQLLSVPSIPVFPVRSDNFAQSGFDTKDCVCNHVVELIRSILSSGSFA